jgi:hypothetical protein
VIVSDLETKRKLAEAANRQIFIEGAPALIVACAETSGHIVRCGQACCPIDVAIALDHITLSVSILVQ